MSNVVQINAEEIRLERVSEWIAKIDRGLSTAEKQAFQMWLAQDVRNPEMLTNMARLWDKMDALSQLSDVFPHSPSQQKSRGSNKFSMAASFLLASILAIAVWQTNLFTTSDQVAQQVLSENTYVTQVGESSTFYMQDNTKVVLNTDSRVKVTYTDRQRLFELLQGELHVTVAHNMAQPLTVYAGGKMIQAVGTAFNVEIKHAEVELIVTDGKVLVAENKTLGTSLLHEENVYLPIDSLAISKGEKIALGAEFDEVVTLKQSDLEADLSWQQGNLIFRGDSLESAMQEVSRYTAYEFELADDMLKQIQIAGLFKTGDVDGLLDALEQNFNVRHQRVGSNKIRLRLSATSI